MAMREVESADGLRGPASRPRTAAGRTVVVVGNGMVSHRFCERVLEYDTEGTTRLVVIGEEPRPAYDRVHLTSYFEDRAPERLLLGTRSWYSERGIELVLGTRVVAIDREAKLVRTNLGGAFGYDVLVLATGSASFVPPIPGIERPGVFVYRTIEDLDGIIAHASQAGPVAVIGGGLLGLEAARAVHDAGHETHVFEVAPRLMPRQLDVAASALLEQTIRGLGVHVHLDAKIARIVGDVDVEAIELADGSRLDVGMIIVSAGIKPRDELAADSGIARGPRGGIAVDDRLQTNDPAIFAIGEVALHDGLLYGLVAPGYDMADALAQNLFGREAAFRGSDLSAKLKLLGTDVATFGDPFQGGITKAISYEDQVRGIYKKVVVDETGKRLLGGILVGDAASYGHLLHLTRSKTPLSESLDELGIGGGNAAPDASALPDDAQVCSCNNVLAGAIRASIRDGELTTAAQVKACTRAGTGCGGCMPLVSDLLDAELVACGRVVKKVLCEHFAFTRQELFEITAATGLTTFDELLRAHGSGDGCEVCKPAVASILASLYNEPILRREHRSLQDTNDRFLANIQRNGTYSVVPRIAGGEVTPDQLIALGTVAKKYGLYTKITGGQRVDLFGARVGDLPSIWEELIEAGFESGHAYGKAMRTVKSCVGSTWCRFGVQDSTSFAIRIENRYKGVRAPHKFKSAVSGCVRECAEAQSKDFGLIATEKGWNIYVGGNGGVTPRHADLLVSDIDEETAIRYLDRFLMFYIRTADRLMRTSVWIDKMEGGISHLRNVVVNDALGIAADLERQMQRLVDTYACEWADVVRDPEKRALFRHYANDTKGDETVAFVPERGQLRPADAPAKKVLPLFKPKAVSPRTWVRLASVGDVPASGGIAVRYGNAQIALFNFASRGEWYAIQNQCPHSGAMVLARGLLGDHQGAPKVACPLHKKTFDLQTGGCLSGDELAVSTFPVRVQGDGVYVELPPVDELSAPALASSCTHEARTA